MNRRRRNRRLLRAAQGTAVLPLLAGICAWAVLGEPGHADGFLTTLGACLAAAVPMPVCTVSAQVFPLLLIPAEWRARWRQGRARPALPKWLRRAIMAADRHHCAWCGEPGPLHIDHIRPWSLGGLNAFWNLMVLCEACNLTKSNCWVFKGGRDTYHPWEGSESKQEALRILAYEKLHRWWPGRWIRAGWSLGNEA